MSRKLGWLKYDGRYVRYELAVCPGCGHTYYVNGPQDRNHDFCMGYTMSGVPGDVGWLDDWYLEGNVTKVELTAENGKKVWVFTSSIELVREPIPGEHEGKANAMLLLTSYRQGVRETVAEVMEKLEFA